MNGNEIKFSKLPTLRKACYCYAHVIWALRSNFIHGLLTKTKSRFWISNRLSYYLAS